MKTTVIVTLSVVVVVILASAFLIGTQQGATSNPSGTSSVSSTATGSSISTSVSQSMTSTGTVGGSGVDAAQDLQLRLSVDASTTGGQDGNVTLQIAVSEYSTRTTANNVSAATEWGLNDTTLGSCGRSIYPFGVAVFSGTYTAGNVSQATPMQIYPIVPCPMFIRLVTGYLFQPASDLAVVLPSSSNATATSMSANINATSNYSSGVVMSSPLPLGPGTYTIAAGDEWGSVVLVHVTIGTNAGAISTSSTAGAVDASFAIQRDR